MAKIELGLPIEYKKLPELFDAHNVCADTEAKNEVVAGLLKEYGVKTVLDLTCGTGSQVFFLARCGYEITGSDFSSALLEQAREKARREKLSLKFIDGDMRTVRVGEFDAVITMFNAVGHLTKKDFGKALKNIGKNLKKGGIYIFDILNLEAMTDKAVDNFAMDMRYTVDDAQVRQIQRSTINRADGLLTSCDDYVIEKNGEEKKLRNEFTLQIYKAAELGEMLAQSGFKVLNFYEIDGSKFSQKKSISILTVAQKNN